jgi:predicted RNA-binding protein with PIN domain
MHSHITYYTAHGIDQNEARHNSYTKYISYSGNCTLLRYNLPMPYLIDGHNLIPKLGLRLDSIDDEMELIAILQEFYKQDRKPIEVYFDGAPPAHAGTRKLGTVTAHFVRLGSTADNAIRDRLKSLAKSAKNWTVVSSDRQVQAEATAMRAEIVSSDSFAAMLKHKRDSAPKPQSDRKLSDTEIDEWMRLFQKGKPK